MAIEGGIGDAVGVDGEEGVACDEGSQFFGEKGLALSAVGRGVAARQAELDASDGAPH